jgi:hypothetical protein
MYLNQKKNTADFNFYKDKFWQGCIVKRMLYTVDGNINCLL